jgi:hypothetical protein
MRATSWQAGCSMQPACLAGATGRASGPWHATPMRMRTQSGLNAGYALLTWWPVTAQAQRRRMRRTTSAAARAARPRRRARRTRPGRRAPARRARSAAASRATTGSACLRRRRRRRRNRLQAQVRPAKSVQIRMGATRAAPAAVGAMAACPGCTTPVCFQLTSLCREPGGTGGPDPAEARPQ